MVFNANKPHYEIRPADVVFHTGYNRFCILFGMGACVFDQDWYRIPFGVSVTHIMVHEISNAAVKVRIHQKDLPVHSKTHLCRPDLHSFLDRLGNR